MGVEEKGESAQSAPSSNQLPEVKGKLPAGIPLWNQFGYVDWQRIQSSQNRPHKPSMRGNEFGAQPPKPKDR